MPRLKPTHLIRMDALTTGIKKADKGCIPCMQKYFELAKSHGASDEEIEAARQQIKNPIAKPEIDPTLYKAVDRRQVIKLAARGSLATVAVGELILETNLSTHIAQAAAEAKTKKHGQSMWWGTDSSSAAAYAMPQHFYIGRMGYGTQPTGDGYFFNSDAAVHAGHAHTFGYWGVVGPDICPNGTSPFDWGRRQATCAWNARRNGPHANYIGGLTVFGDFERDFNGWQHGNMNANRAVLSGFLSELFSITPPHVWPGVYISPAIWKAFFGSDYRPTTDFVLWLTGFHTCSPTICAPHDDTCNTLQTARTTMNQITSNIILGGRKAVVWQYWISGCGSGDYNLMIQNAPSLIPINTRTVYAVTN